MKSLRSHEGYMLVDNRNGPGVDDATMIAMGYPVGAGRGMYESATYTCSHCNSIVVIEPKRTRERGFCRKCSQKICDACTTVMATTFECLTVREIADIVQESSITGTDPLKILAKEAAFSQRFASEHRQSDETQSIILP